MFPLINTIHDVLWALEDENGERGEEWIVDDRHGFTVINYAVAYEHTFPEIVDGMDERDVLKARLRRECRGIKFDTATGLIAARCFHKFFNLNERESTQAHNFDWGKEHVIFEKLDGSMIHPIRINGEIKMCTKMGPTEVAQPVQRFVEANSDYLDFCEEMMFAQCTPLFEWCSRKQRIVVDYPEDMLILTAVRNNVTGHYYEELEALALPFDIPFVNTYGSVDGEINDYITTVRAEEEGEGYVIRFTEASGEQVFLKIKNDLYCRIHSTKELLAFDKNVWRIVLDDSVDDASAMMDDDDRERFTRFADALNHAMVSLADEITKRALSEKDEIVAKVGDDMGLVKKTFAIEYAGKYDPRIKGVAFGVFDGLDALEQIHRFVDKNINTGTKVDAIRDLFGGLNWIEFE